MTSQGYQQMAGVERAVAEQRRKNVHRYQSEPVVPLPEPGEQNSEAFEATLPKKKKKMRQIVWETQTDLLFRNRDHGGLNLLCDV